MQNINEVKYYSPFEEKINIISHTFGVILGIIGLFLLIIHASSYGNVWHVISFTIYGLSVIALFSASAIYHSTNEPNLRSRLRIIDHTSIYILIAGTYTPLTLVTLHGTLGWVLFGIVWGLALIGIILKLFFTGKYNFASTLMYILMGWMIVFAVKPLSNSFSSDGLFWLVAGGVLYTIGAVIYSIKKIKLNHAIFHLFVLCAGVCHFIMVYFYILPGE
ncbi:MAG: hemolysin III family protein [Melioribacteraceae bacterium]|nr:hemolysin III family protein [Melioribacteraceae bacterium]